MLSVSVNLLILNRGIRQQTDIYLNSMVIKMLYKEIK